MSICRGQCSCRAFGFGGENPFQFAAPLLRWPLFPGSFIVYRWLLALYQLVVFIVNLILWGQDKESNHSTKAKYLIFISNWSFTILTLYTTWSAFATTYWHFAGKKGVTVGSTNGNDIAMENSNATEAQMVESERSTPSQTPWYFKVNWFLQVIACDAEFAVTGLFWLLEYDPGDPGTDFFTFNVHGVGFALVLVDFLLVANPWRILHLVWPALYSAVYFLFTYIYFVAGGLNTQGTTSIYSSNLDWGETVERSFMVSLIAIFVGSPAIHLIYFLLYYIKQTMKKCCGCCQPRSAPEDIQKTDKLTV